MGSGFLLGGSWGATFATYGLLERPDTFDGAIAIAANYQPGRDVMQKRIGRLSKTNALAGKRLYIGVGSWDPVVNGVLELADALKKAELKGFNLKLEQLDGYGHSGMNLPGYAGGYQHMFKRPKLELPINTVEQYVGEYINPTAESDNFTISLVADGLVITNSAGQVNHLWARTENQFYHPGLFLELNFSNGKAEVVTFFGKNSYLKQ